MVVCPTEIKNMKSISPKKYSRLKNRGRLLEFEDEYDASEALNEGDYPARECGNHQDQTRRFSVSSSQDIAGASRSSINDSNGVFIKTTSKENTSWKVKLLVFICGVIIVIGVTLIIKFHETDEVIKISQDSGYATAELILTKNTINIRDKQSRVRLTISLGGDEFDVLSSGQRCSESSNNACVRLPLQNNTLHVKPAELNSPNSETQCFNISWTYTQVHKPEDCVYFDAAASSKNTGPLVWFDSLHYIVWPKKSEDNKCETSCREYIPTLNKDDDNPAGGTVIEPIWFSSQGSFITSSPNTPLEACLKICADAALSKVCLKNHLHTHKDYGFINWSYMVCIGSNVTDMIFNVMDSSAMYGAGVVDGILGNLKLEKSTSKLSESCAQLFDKPLWNIMLNGDEYENGDIILQELKDIAAIGGTGFIHNVTSIYSNIGDFQFCSGNKFKVDDFISTMHRMNFSVMLPVVPFVNNDAVVFQEAAKRGLLLKNEFNNAPVLTDPHMFGHYIYPGMVDFTNPSAFEWFSDNIKSFRKRSNTDFIQLLYGQIAWIASRYKTQNFLSNPGFYSTLYSNVGYYLDSCPLTDVAFASRNQNQIILLQSSDGLEGTLRLALATGLAGYPFFIPELPFKLEEVNELPPEYLEDGYIRWAQLVSFFPVAHMPWDFHILQKRGVNITRIVSCVSKCMNMRNGPLVKPSMKSAIKYSEETRRPIVSPMWMAPGTSPISDSSEAGKIFLIDDQFMIGSDMLFAPILEMKTTQRNVYFPSGTWVKVTEPEKKIVSDGKFRMKDFNVIADDFLLFVRDRNPSNT